MHVQGFCWVIIWTITRPLLAQECSFDICFPAVSHPASDLSTATKVDLRSNYIADMTAWGISWDKKIIQPGAILQAVNFTKSLILRKCPVSRRQSL